MKEIFSQTDNIMTYQDLYISLLCVALIFIVPAVVLYVHNKRKLI
ncbi:MAG: hypothetical protein WKF97_13885 [Chitinophagaceae bacterium]